MSRELHISRNDTERMAPLGLPDTWGLLAGGAVVLALAALAGLFIALLRTVSGWGPLDTWIVITGALAAMACALPGNFLLLRRQSMMGDALSHTVLLGIVVAFLLTHHLIAKGWFSPETYTATKHVAMFFGAVIIGVVTAVLTEWVERLGRVESSAALGVVFTTLFALGLILIRVAADNVDIDPGCVFYGTIETVVMDTYRNTGIPTAALVNGGMLAANLLLLSLFYKELRISTFDGRLATTLGINAQWMQYALMAVTAATLVAAFESVGSILVIAMLIVPAATASLLTDRLGPMILLSLVIAAMSAVLGHVLAITLPPILFSRLGFPDVVDASTAGMMAAACGLLFVMAMVCAPRHGMLSKALDQLRLGIKIACEDVLGMLYRFEESKRPAAQQFAATPVGTVRGVGPILTRFALARLRRRGEIVADASGYHLTPSGRRAAEELIRSHRLWETYMAEHFAIPSDHLHQTAERVEHYIDPVIREALAAELDRPEHDPHGRLIPPEGDNPS